ncbi:unnamed protein product, partial [Sphagnum compactum]
MTLIFAQSLFFLSSAVPFACCLLLCFFPLVGCWVLLFSHPPPPPSPNPPTHKKLYHFHLRSSFHCTCYLLHSISQTPCVLARGAWYTFAALHFSSCGGGAVFFFSFVCLLLQCKFSLTFGGGFYLSFSS